MIIHGVSSITKKKAPKVIEGLGYVGKLKDISDSAPSYIQGPANRDEPFKLGNDPKMYPTELALRTDMGPNWERAFSIYAIDITMNEI